MTTTRRELRVVVTCAHRKSRPVPRELRLRSLTGVRITTRVRVWTERLTAHLTESVAARHLYAGEHWTIALELADASSDVDLWVCSAGYGLIPASTRIRPYSATFGGGHPDSTTGGRPGARAWWQALAEWDGPARSPRSFAELAQLEPHGRMLLALSAPYLAACRDDIIQAAQSMVDSNAISIVSAGTKAADDDVADLLLPVDARLQAAMGGTLQSLNVRVAAHLLDSGLTTHEEMRDYLFSLLTVQPERPRFDRERLTDGAVRRFIRSAVGRDAGTTHTALLRSLRDAGMACEQGRFAQLFQDEKAKL